ncbi:MAG: hypothetical protein FWE14_05250 [Lachnospiraceae bacterium]|nr:hypothetical protein [Lachnospiraceae bacterium]
MKKKFIRFISSILILSMLFSLIIVTPVSATADKATADAMEDAALPTRAGDWQTAIFVDRLPWNFFHNQVQKKIVKDNQDIGMEHTVPGGRADLYKIDGGFTYLWEVKPASYSVEPKRTQGLLQLQGYVGDETKYKIGNTDGTDIQGGTFVASIETGYPQVPPGVRYTITYYNPGNGLILYSFTREKDEDDEKDTDVDVPIVIPVPDDKDNDQSGSGGNRTNVIQFPITVPGESDPREWPGAAFSPNQFPDTVLADALAAFINDAMANAGPIIIGGICIATTIIAMEKWSSVKPSQWVTAYSLGLISPADFLDIMTIALGIERDFLQELANDAAGNGIAETEDLFSNVRGTVSPIAINLDGSGIESLSLRNGVYFDHTGNGFRTKSGWVAPNTGLLVRGVDENSRIISGRNLFGDNTLLKNGRLAANGFEALKDLDDNNNGIFDANDAAFHELYLWFDLNSNGRIDPGELIPLSETGIVSIDLNYVNSDYIDSNGNAFKQISTADMEDGTIIDVIDIWFVRDVQDTRAVDRVRVSDEIRALPQIRGFGTTHSLQQAMMLDTSERLKGLVEQFIEEENESARRRLVPQIINRWTGTTTNLAALESFSGIKYTGALGPNATAVLNRGFDRFANIIYEVLMSQTHYQSLYGNMFIAGGTDEVPFYDLVLVALEILAALSENQSDGEKLLVDFIANMHALTMLDLVDLDGFQDVFADYNNRYGIIVDIARKNIIFGTSGNDNLTGTNGNTAFLSGVGNNTLNGGTGDDTFFFNKNSGINTIINAGGNNTIILSDVNPGDMDVKKTINTRNRFNLEITFAGLSGRIIIQDFLFNANYILVFPDGTLVDLIQYFPTINISSVEDLQNIQNDMFGNYQLVNDIDLSGVAWSPIGTLAAPFNGLLDGNGHTIKNLNINLPTQDNVGLFRFNRGIITNINLENVSITGRDNTGSIVGQNFNSLTNITVTTVKELRGLNSVGGLAGVNTGTIIDSTVENAEVLGGTSTAARTGGLVGNNTGTIIGSNVNGIKNLTGGSNTGGLAGINTGTIATSWSIGIANLTGSTSTGGLAGSSNGTIRLSFSDNNVRGTSDVGGLVGLMNGGMIEQGYATGAINSNSSGGGFVGRMSVASAIVRNSYSAGNVSGSTTNAGFVGTLGNQNARIENCYSLSSHPNGLISGTIGTIVNSYFEVDRLGAGSNSSFARSKTEMLQTETYESWNFDTVWEITDGGYPTLAGMNMTHSGKSDIHTAEDLSAIRNNLGGNYRLMADIDLSDIEWQPIGTAASPFIGVFEGNGYTIRNLNINLPAQDNVGLFGVSNSSITNVNLENISVIGRDNTGSIAGQSTNSLINIMVNNVTELRGRNNVGGLVGNNTGAITACRVIDIDRLTGGNGTGGLVGNNNGIITDSSIENISLLTGAAGTGGLVGSNTGTITNSQSVGITSLTGSSSTGGFAGSSSGTIHFSSSTNNVRGTSEVGGFVGNISGGTISESSATGSINASSINIGGFVGSMTSGTIKESFATGNVTTSSSTAGGFAGSFTRGIIEQSYATGNINATANIGGFAGNMAVANNTSAILRNSFASGSVSSALSAGGFIGNMSAGATASVSRIENSYTISSNINGFKGLTAGAVQIISSYFSTTITGRPSAAPEAKSTAQMKNQETFDGWDFANIWELEDGAFPALKGLGGAISTDYIAITTAEELSAISDNLSGNFRLEADIDLSGTGWQPIGTATTPFSGILAGNGHTIAGLAVNLATQDNIGLFGVNAGLITELNIRNADITGRNSVGVLAGQNRGLISNVTINGGNLRATGILGGLAGINTASGTIENSASINIINLTASSNIVGGLIGNNQGAITNSSSKGISILSGPDNIGGLTGVNSGTINESESNNNIVGRSNIGGLIGSMTAGIVEQSHATGNINSTGSAVGGFIGNLSGGTINKSSATGLITANSNNIGGFIGSMSNGTVSESSAAGNTTTSSFTAGGFIGSFTRGIIEQSYATGSTNATANIGGFVGNMVVANNTSAIIRNSFASGSVSSALSAGGFVGNMGTGTSASVSRIENSYTISSNINGFRGTATGTIQILSSYFSTTITNRLSSAPEAKTTVQMKSQETFDGWDFADIWELENGSFPALKGLGGAISTDYIAITTAEELSAIRNNLSGNFRLEADIDLSRIGWQPIGNTITPFSGILDGNGYTITGLTANLTTQDNVGLFSVNAGIITDLIIKDPNIIGRNNIGALAGQNRGLITNITVDGGSLRATGILGGLIGINNTSGIIEDSVSINIISLTASSNTIGGLVGNNQGMVSNVSSNGIATLSGLDNIGGLIGTNSGTINKSESNNNITGRNNVGGLIGTITGGTVEQSNAIGNVNATGSVGGFIGNISAGIIRECYATGNVTATSDNAGGFIGTMTSGTITESYAVGSITSSGSRAGGFIGSFTRGGIEQSFATGNVNATANIGGFVGIMAVTNNTSAIIKNSFASGGISSALSAGGFVGNISAGATASISRIENSYTISNNINGFRGTATGAIQIISSYFSTTITGRPSTSPEARTTVQMKNQETFADWDFIDIWELEDGAFPALKGLGGAISMSGIGITTAEELSAIRNNLSGNFYLEADIDLSEIEWQPIGSTTTPFSGIITGNGYTINGLTISLTTQDNVGLFGVNAGLITDLSIKDTNITGRNNVGTLAGQNRGLITNVSIDGGTLRATGTIGGLTGINTSSGVIEESFSINITSLTASSSIAGGLVGNNQGAIQNGFSNGIATLSGLDNVGGLIGTNSGTINQSESNNNITGRSNVGGLIGSMSGGMVEQSHATGNINATGSAGSLTGNMTRGSLLNSHGTGNVTIR